jgi:hypothetical protein
VRLRRVVLSGLSAALFAAWPALADSITPDTLSRTLAVGETVNLAKTVTVTQTATGAVDVFFLVDTTGSMGGSISNVASGFSSIVNDIGMVAPNVAFGLGDYKDVFDSYIYRQDADLTTSTATVQTAIGGLSASGGGDLPEANLFALQQAATSTSWRTSSQRFLVWVGDAPGHDPSNGVTEADATAALQDARATVLALSATSGPGIDSTGQATRIANATGGSFLGTFSPTQVSTTISDALTTVITNYNTVELAVFGLPAGVSVTLPSAISGSFDRSTDRTFNFNVAFAGVTPGTYNFTIQALVDGRPIATETDAITVAGGTVIPEPSTYLLLSSALMGLAFFRKRKRTVDS